LFESRLKRRDFFKPRYFAKNIADKAKADKAKADKAKEGVLSPLSYPSFFHPKRTNKRRQLILSSRAPTARAILSNPALICQPQNDNIIISGKSGVLNGKL
jgi:hypothetical protein